MWVGTDHELMNSIKLHQMLLFLLSLGTPRNAVNIEAGSHLFTLSTSEAKGSYDDYSKPARGCIKREFLPKL